MAPLQKSVTIIIHRGKSDELNTVAGVKNKVFKALPLTNTLLFFKSVNSSLCRDTTDMYSTINSSCS